MRRPAIILLAVIALATACGDGQSDSGLPTGTLVIEAGGGEIAVDVEIAETRAARTRGLMGRESLPDDAGMVFLGDEVAATPFWMKDTLIPLSVAFWGVDQRISEILDMEPCRTQNCPFYAPQAAWIGAVEVNQGFLDDSGVSVGDLVRLER